MEEDGRIIFKPKNSREEFFVFVNSDQVSKWRKDKSIPVTDVVQTFDIFETVNGGNEGIAGRPSKQKLENTFGTSNVNNVVEHILQHGIVHSGRKGRPSKDGSVTNETRGKGVSTAGNSYGIHN